MSETQRSQPMAVDAVVIGGGHHGLVAATTLADAGWDVVLLEARDHVGGAVSSVDRDGWVMDEFSACHPLAVVSPITRELRLEQHGLRWCRSDAVLAHAGSPQDTDGAAIMSGPHAKPFSGRTTPRMRAPGSRSWRSGSGSGFRCWTPCSRAGRR